MKRTDKEIRDRDVIDTIIRQCQVCRIGLCKNNVPYVVPLSFGYNGKCLYFHTAREGRKIEFIESNDYVCFEFENNIQIHPNEKNPCEWGCSFQSVIGYGHMKELNDSGEKEEALNHITMQYSGKSWSFDTTNIRSVRIWCLAIESLSGKQS